jgi:hypothetical protein
VARVGNCLAISDLPSITELPRSKALDTRRAGLLVACPERHSVVGKCQISLCGNVPVSRGTKPLVDAPPGRTPLPAETGGTKCEVATAGGVALGSPKKTCDADRTEHASILARI